jgi:hypothetical protein
MHLAVSYLLGFPACSNCYKHFWKLKIEIVLNFVPVFPINALPSILTVLFWLSRNVIAQFS